MPTPYYTDEYVDPTGLGLPPPDPNAPPVDIGQALGNAASAVGGAIFPHAGSEYDQLHPAPPATAAPATAVAPPPPPPVVAAPAPAPTPAAAAPPTPRARAAAPAPAAETKGEEAARKEERAAEAKQLETAGAETGLGERKAAAELARTEAEAKAHQEFRAEADRKNGEAYQYLQAKQDEAANFKVKDLYDGHIGAGIAAALMEGLGAYAAVLSGGENHAAKAIERGRQQYRQQQMDELEQKYKGVANAKDRAEFVRMELAAKEAGMLQGLADERAKNIARFGGDQAKIDGDKRRNDLLTKSAEQERVYQSMLHGRTMQEKLQGSEITKNYAEANKANAEAAAASGKGKSDPAQLEVTGPDGKPLFRARNPEEAKEARDQMSAVRDVLAKAGELKALIAQGRTVPGSDRAGQMEALQSKIMIAVNHAEKLGAMDKGSQEILERMLPTGYGWSGQGPARIEQFLKMTREGAARKFDSYGVPGDKVVGYLDRAEAGGAARPKPSTVEYAQVADAYRRAAPGSPDQARLGKTLQGMRAAMGR